MFCLEIASQNIVTKFHLPSSQLFSFSLFILAPYMYAHRLYIVVYATTHAHTAQYIAYVVAGCILLEKERERMRGRYACFLVIPSLLFLSLSYNYNKKFRQLPIVFVNEFKCVVRPAL